VAARTALLMMAGSFDRVETEDIAVERYSQLALRAATYRRKVLEPRRIWVSCHVNTPHDGALPPLLQLNRRRAFR